MENKEAEAAFDDIKNHWAESYIKEAESKEIVIKEDETEFYPDKKITRGEFASALSKALNLRQYKFDVYFTDIHPSAWYTPSVISVYKAGLMQGYKEFFRPEDNITRQEIAVVLGKVIEGKGNTTEFKDNESIAPWAMDGIEKCVASGILSGYEDNTLRPEGNATRAEVIKMLLLLSNIKNK